MHNTKSSLAGKTVKNKADANQLGGQEYRVEDWWDRVSGKSWGVCQGSPACISYAARTGFSEVPVPFDDEVLYGKIGCFGHLVHLSEIEEVK